MQVVSLTGSSGTGKSYRALVVAKENDIDYVIDDGLFIKGNKIIAGASAKKENTKIAAVRRALFMDPEHRQEVVEAIRSTIPKNTGFGHFGRNGGQDYRAWVLARPA